MSRLLRLPPIIKTSPVASSASPAAPRRPVGTAIVPDAVLAMLVFVACEVMFFAALISAQFVVRGSAGQWPPVDQPRLPVVTTAANTLILLASGFMLWLAVRARKDKQQDQTCRKLRWAVWLGSAFVAVQGFEWTRLIHFGLTLQSSSYGSFFYLIIGAHAAHAVVALGFLMRVWQLLVAGSLTESRWQAAQVFWYFVVGLWPFLYVLVYLL